MSHDVDPEYVYAVYDERFPRAAKDYPCVACKEVIRKGDRYAKVFAVWCDGKDHLRRCLRCQEMHTQLRKTLMESEQWPDERLNCGETYEQHFERPPPEELARLAFLTRDEAQTELKKKP